MHNTKVINIIAGPGAGKTTICALLFYELKIRKHVTEYVQEYAKTLVWKKDFDILNNQYLVTTEQYKLFKTMIGQVDYVVTDGSLLHGLYYNRYNIHNTSNVEKTEQLILDCFGQFNNINIFLERGTSYPYETQGRIQTEEEAKEIDNILKHLLRLHKISYITLTADNIEAFLDNILPKK
jgi:tRNA uridine 5-carbamoylmethylation protein Kti12